MRTECEDFETALATNSLGPRRLTRALPGPLLAALAERLRPGDLLVVDDAATRPATLPGRHERTGMPIAVRLAVRTSVDPGEMRASRALLLGPGDWRARTEDRPPPPRVAPGDRSVLAGDLRAEVADLDLHPCRVGLTLSGPARNVWEGLLRGGELVQ